MPWGRLKGRAPGYSARAACGRLHQTSNSLSNRVRRHLAGEPPNGATQTRISFLFRPQLAKQFGVSQP
jgi:hypothetical protein